ERLLRVMGARVEIDNSRITVWPPECLRAVDIDVPGDFSSAAFWLVAGFILPGATVMVRNVGMNESRTGLLDVLEEMGARVEVRNARDVGGEPVADLVARHASLRGVTVGGTIIPRRIDEAPVLAVAAALETLGDHRLAMAWAIAGLATRDGLRIDDRECASVSYPSFWQDLESFHAAG